MTVSLGDSLIVQFQMTQLQLNKPSCLFSSFLLFSSSFLVFLSSSCFNSNWMILVFNVSSLFSYHLVYFTNQDNANMFGFLYINNLQIIFFKIFYSLWYQWGSDCKNLKYSYFSENPIKENPCRVKEMGIGNINALIFSPTTKIKKNMQSNFLRLQKRQQLKEHY